jgi:hypothetical protein
MAPIAFGDLVQVAVGQRADEVVRADRAGGGFHFGVRCRRAAVGDVVPDRAGEEERLLRYVAEMVPGLRRDDRDAEAVDRAVAPCLDVDKPRDLTRSVTVE